jgi:hypothetical protein
LVCLWLICGFVGRSLCCLLALARLFQTLSGTGFFEGFVLGAGGLRCCPVGELPTAPSPVPPQPFGDKLTDRVSRECGDHFQVVGLDHAVGLVRHRPHERLHE